MNHGRRIKELILEVENTYKLKMKLLITADFLPRVYQSRKRNQAMNGISIVKDPRKASQAHNS